MADAEGGSIQELSARMDQIVAQVRGKQTSLEESLDLLDEAIRLGSRAVELVDTARPGAQELDAAARDGAGEPAATPGEAADGVDAGPAGQGAATSGPDVSEGADQEGK